MYFVPLKVSHCQPILLQGGSVFTCVHMGRLASIFYLDYSVRREQALGGSPVPVLSGEWSGHPRRDRAGQQGNRLVEALETEAHVGWVSELTGRNLCEA
jgi:hypothetical protein